MNDPRTRSGMALLMAYPDIGGRPALRKLILAIEEEATIKADQNAAARRSTPELDMERLARAMQNEAERERIDWQQYPKGWRERAYRLAAEYDRLTGDAR